MSFTVEEEKPLVEDFLSVDQPVPGQNFCCMSFVSPEKVIRRKQMYLVKEFLKDLFTKHEDKVVPESSAESHQKLASEQREVIKKIRWDKFNRLFEEDFPYESVNDLFENYCVVNEDKVNNEEDEEISKMFSGKRDLLSTDEELALHIFHKFNIDRETMESMPAFEEKMKPLFDKEKEK